jgi:hypothetical protein
MPLLCLWCSCAKSAWYARLQHSYNICKEFLSHDSWMKNLNFTNSCTINMNWNIYTIDSLMICILFDEISIFHSRVMGHYSSNCRRFFVCLAVNWEPLHQFTSNFVLHDSHGHFLISNKSVITCKINSCAKSSWYARRQHSYNICKELWAGI